MEIMRAEHPKDRCDNQPDKHDSREHMQDVPPAAMMSFGIIPVRIAGSCILHGKILSDADTDLAHARYSV